MSKRLDLTGYRHPEGKLTALNYSHRDIKQGAVWDCLCDCGSRKKISAHILRSGLTKSCGCLMRDQRFAKATQHQAFGEFKSAPEWAKDPRCKINVFLLWDRLRKGMDPELAMTRPARKKRPKPSSIPLKELLLGRTA